MKTKMRSHWQSVLITGVVVLGLSQTACLDAWAYQVKRVVRGATSLGTATEVAVLDVSSQLGGVGFDLEKTFLLTKTRIGGTDDNRRIFLGGQLEDATNLIFSRNTSVTTIYLEYQAVEFVSGVQVQSGMTTIGEASTTKVITLPLDAPSDRSFPLLSWRAFSDQATSNDDLNMFAADMTGTKQLTLRRSGVRAGCNNDFVYQVVTFDRDVRVQKGSSTFGTADNTVTVNLNNAPTYYPCVPSKSFVMAYYLAHVNAAGYEGRWMARAEITDANTLTFSRGYTGTADIVYWYLVEFQNEALVKQSSVSYGSGSTGSTILIPDSDSLDLSRSFATASWTAQTASRTDHCDFFFTVQMPDSTHVTLTRIGTVTIQPSTVNWYAPEMAPLDIILPAGSATDTNYAAATQWTIGGNGVISWYYADSMKTGGGGTNSVHRIKIEVSVDGGTTWLQVPGATSLDVDTGTLDNYGSWTWTNIPASISTTNLLTKYGTDPKSRLKIKISDIESGVGTRNFDISNGYFIINPTLTVVQPPNTWKIGNSPNITWNSTGDLTGKTVTISLATDGTTFDHTIASGVSAPAGSYAWAIPSITSSTKNPIGTANKIRIVYDEDPLPPYTSISSTSTAFTLKGQISNVTPTSSVTWLLGENHTLTWNKKGYLDGGTTDGNGTVDIYYSNNGDVPSNYTLISPLLSPPSAGTDASGGSWDWEMSMTLGTSISNNSSYIKVVNHTDSSVYAVSSGFTVKGSLTINNPVGGEIWYYGDTQPVRWTPHGTIPYIVIKYKVGAAGSWEYAVGAGPSDNLPGGTAETLQTFNWSIPNVYGNNNVYVRVCTKADEDVYAEAGPFSIKGRIIVGEPHANELLKVTEPAKNNTKNITWTVQGTVTGTADIRLSQDDGTSWGATAITENTVDINAGSFTWTVPGTALTDTAKIKVALDGDESATTGYCGISSSFKIVPYLELLYPNATGLSYSIGDTIYIRWTPYPVGFGNVDITYDTNSGSGGYTNNIILGWPASNKPNGTDYGYEWTIPNVTGIVGSKVRIKVFQSGKETACFDNSLYDFAIKGTITLTGEANGGPAVTWKNGDSKAIAWNYTGDIGVVDIYYSTDGGETYAYDIATGVSVGTGGSGSYLWSPIPDDVIANDRNTNIRFKVQSQDGSMVSTSAQNLTIQGKLVLVHPVGGETLYVSDPAVPADTYQISWQTYGNIGQVKLYYDTNSGNNGYSNTIAGGLAITNLDGYAWVVPAAIGTTLRVKVVSNAEPTNISTESTGDFTIKGKIKITAPTSANVNASALRVNSVDLPSTYLIQWKDFGDLGTVNIYLSTDGGASYTQIATDSGANGNQSYNWAPPATIGVGATNTIGTTNRIKITQATDETFVYAESEEFEIKGQIAITDPNGGEVYNINGTPIDITWNYAGDSGNIDIFFSSDNGASWGDKVATVGVTSAQPYSFAVPSTVTTQGKIKLEAVSDRTYVSSITANPGFAIKGSVNLTFPDNNPALSVNVGGNLSITWGIVGSIQNVAIDYDKNSGNDGYLGVVIGQTAAAAGSYGWTIPSTDAAVSDHVRIRVRDFSDGTVKDESQADFKIKPIVDLTAPVGNEGWVVAELHDITWTTLGFSVGQQVKLRYSDDGGATWPTGSPYEIAEVSAASGIYNWQIPDGVLSSKCVVRITKLGDTAVADESPWFTIKGKLDITQPDGNVNLPINTPYTIKWSRVGSGVGNIALYYAIDAGHANWTAISGAESLASSGGATGFSWTIPDAPSTTVRVKAVAVTAGDPTSEDMSATDNAIVGSIFLSTPNPATGDTMIAENNYNISWTKFGSISSFDVYYSYDNKQSWNQIGNDITSLNLLWPVEDHISTQVHFRVVDAGNANVLTETSAASTIKGSINLTSPDGGNTLLVGQPFNIAWSKTGTIGNVKIEYSEDDFDQDIRTINASYSGVSPYAWTPGINDITNADTVKVRLTSIGGIPVTDKSTGSFKIVGQIVNIQPSGSINIWNNGQTKTITWNQVGNIPTVDIMYKTAAIDPYNKTIIINHSGHADGANSYDCTVPDENSEDCWIQVSDHDNSDVKGTSAAAFSIRPVITVSAPALDQVIRVGSNNTNGVQWSVNGSTKVNPVNIQYSTAGAGGPYGNTIANNVAAADGQVNWNGVSDHISNTVVVRVIDSINANTLGMSNVFKIAGSLTVSGPNGAEDWGVGDTNRTISWTKTGTLGNVNIYADYGAGYVPTPIGTVDTAVANSFAWNPIPDQVSNNVKIKVSSATDPTNVTDESDAVFHIIGKFGISLPDGSPLISGDPYTITWTPTGAGVNKVKIEFFDGSGWSTIAEQASNSGTYGWTIPSTTASTSCKIRLTASDPVQAATATESVPFWVHGNIGITAPTSGNQWTVGTSENIVFSVMGKIDNVNIKYSKNGGTDNYAYTIASGVVVTSGSNTYPWAIPTNQDILSAAGARVRVIDSAYATVYGTSQNFMLKGVLAVLTPSADNIILTYTGTSTYNITWQATGPIQNVRIYYSTNDGNTYPNEITTTDGVPATPASLSWDIPNQIVGKHMKIKVVDKDNAVAAGESANTFEIIGVVTLDNPVGGEKWTVASTQPIRWTPTGTFTNVQVQASINDFTGYILNVTRPAGPSGVQQTYSWINLPDNLSNTVKVRVYDPDHQPTLVRDTSDNFTILGGLDLTAPESGQVWYKGEAKTITWDATGSVSNVKIEYKTSSGGAYSTIVVNDGGHSLPGANSYAWTSVSDENSETCYIRVSDVNNYTDVYSVSAATFSIRPKINVTAPTVGTNIRVGSNNLNAIQWNMEGSTKVTTVNVLYSTNGLAGPFDKTIATSVDATLGQVSWNGVANDVSNNVVVRVVDASNVNVYGNSAAFNIVGSIVIQSPNGNEDWPVGGSRNITWTKTGTVGNVNIYVDYGSGYGSSIATVDAEATSLFAWNPIPDQVSNTVRIKVAATNNPTVVFDESDAFFHVIGSFTFTAPNGSPLISGDPFNIEWTPTGSAISKVKVEFFNGSSWSTLAEDATNSGAYPWTIPSTTSATNCRIRLTASTPVQAATATESANFWIHGKVDVTAPTSAAQWTVGTSQNINFSVTGKIDTVNIKYSKDGGVDNYAYTIASGVTVTQGANTYAWPIPTDQPILSNSGAKIKVADGAYATVFGVSQNFMLRGGITVLTPSADGIILTYTGTATYNITWSTAGPVSYLRIYYSTNDGSTYPNEITTTDGVPAMPASFAWDVPNQILGKHLRIKVVDKDNAVTFGESANSFEIIGQVSLDAPVGGEKWPVSSTRSIQWTPTGTFTNVQVQASIDDFSTTILNTTRPAGPSGVQQTYSWTNIPDNLSTTVKVRVYDPDHQPTMVRDESANFTILGSLDLTAPESGQIWYKGEAKTITWDAIGTITNVKIDYKTSAAGAYTTIIANDGGHTAGANSYAWTAVADENTENAYIRVSDASTPDDVNSVSGAPFSIRPQITVTKPALNDVLRVGSNNAAGVTWSLNGSTKVTNVNVVYSTNGIAGPFDKTIATNTDATLGQVNWNGVANDVSTNAVIKVVDTTNVNVFGLSGVFTIAGSIALTAPNGGNNWPVGSSQNITWTKTGTIGNVNIYVDYGAGYLATPIATVDAETASLYAWNPVPDQVSNAVRIKVAAADNPTVIFDESDAVFAIAAFFTINTPADNEVLTVGNSYDITWTRLGSAVTEVKLEYSSNGGVDWTAITTDAVNSGAYPWDVADAISTSCKVRISDPSNANANDESTGYFKIKGSLTVTSPTLGTESWSAGSTYPITWTKTGSIASVNIYYSEDNGTTWTKQNTLAVNASLGTWDWYISESTPLTTEGLIRVADASDATVFDQSNNNFEVKGAVYLQTPNLADLSLRVNDLYNITWTVFGAIQNVELHYSTNGGIAGGGAYLDGNIITTVAASDQTFTWSVPDRIGNNLRVRVRDADNFTIWDESENAFRIRGAVTLATPNGGETWLVGATENITWTKDGTFANVKLEYSTNGFANEDQTVTIVAATSAAALTYPWSVQDAISNTVKIRISDAANAEVVDMSDGSFFIKGALSLLAPNGAETWTVGNKQNITWARTGSIANVKLEYSTDGGATYPGLIIASTPAAAGTYEWTVSDAIGIQTRVRVSDVNDPSVFDVSNANFTIRGSLLLLTPNGAEAWPVGSSHNITWSKMGSVSTVKLEYSTDGGTTYPNTIVASTDATTGTYSWTIPDNTTPIAKVRISNTADENVYDISDANFKIIGSLTLTSPNGNEGWLVGTVHNVTWALVGNIPNVKLDYSTNGGTSYDYSIIASTPGGGLSYSWTIPDTVSVNVKVRVSDATDVTVNDVSNDIFKIQAGFTITSPNGSEVWSVNAAEQITWTKVGTAPSVKLEYSTNGGLDYDKLINASTQNTGTYSWTVPDTISSSCRVKISDAADSTATDASDGNFKIRGSLTLISPNGAEVWIVASQHAVTWSKVGAIATIKLEYSTDGGSTYPGLINASVDGSLGTYNWTIPEVITNQARVRISDNSDGTVEDISNNNFYMKGALLLTAPNGAEEWVVGTGRNITWTRTGPIANVRLEYSTDSGGSYPYAIVGSTDALAGTYSWNIPDVLSTTLRVRVLDALDTLVNDESNADFMIKGSLNLTSPNGSELWTVGESRNITWTRTGSIANVKLEYSTDGGTTYPNQIVAATSAATGVYGWTVPDAIGSQLRVKITDVGNASVSDASEANFTIKGALALIAPNGGEIWAVGSSQNITWNRTGSVANVKLEYSTNGGTSYANTIIESTNASTGTYPWSIPDAIGNQLRVRISDTSNPTVEDTSDANFTVRGSLRVTAPNGAEQWGVGTSQNVTWVRNGSIATVKLEYSTDGGTTYPNTIVASTDAATGSYPWPIPDAINSTAKVRVTSTADSEVYDVSDVNFKIVGVLNLVAPNGGEDWGVNTAQNITWTMAGSISNVRLDYSTNSGSTYANNIVASTPAASLSYLWTIPDAVSDKIRVRIADASDIAVFDTSNADFAIQARFDITSPDGGEVWVVGSAHDILWTRIGSTSNVKLEYSTDSGQNFPNEIIASTPNTGSYSWTIPDSISSSVRVKVSDVTNAEAYNVSDANFKIRGGITVTAPNGSEAWIVGTAYNITWTKVGSIANVKLEYSTDGGATYPNLILASIGAGVGTHAWNIPDTLSLTARVKITDASDSSVYDESNADFKIRGNLVVTAPNGTEEWNVGSVQNITWTRTGSIPTVRLEYSIDGGTTYPAIIIASTDASAGTYAWTIPDAITNLGRVRVSYTADTTVNDVSNANFKIRGVLNLTSPVGSEYWEVAEVKAITWTVTGSITNVRLEYSTDGGATYPNLIVNSTSASVGSYSWTIPDNLTAQARVRVSNITDLTVNDISDANFKIAGKLTVTSPVGGEVWPVGTVQGITWTRVGTIASIGITLSQDGGVTYPTTIIASTPAANLNYGWTIPDIISSTLRVKIANLADADVADVSDANFKIRGNLTLLAPLGEPNQVLLINDNYLIRWSKFGSISNVRLDYSSDGGATYSHNIIASIDASAGQHNWIVPDAPSTQVRVKVSVVGDASVYDASGGNFTIRGGFTLTAPNGAERWAVGTSQNITWTTFGTIPYVKLEFSTNSGQNWNVITNSVTNTGTYGWTIPDAISNTCRVRVYDINDPIASDTSNADFKIHGSLSLSAPNGGETWGVGSAQSIQWTRVGSVSNVRLDYSTDGGATYPNLIVNATPAAVLSYNWSVPDAISTNVKVRISVTGDSTVNDESDGVFKIKGSFLLTAPNGGETWIVGASQNITWTTFGTVANVKLEYSIDGGTEWNSIVNSVANAGTYPWTVPDMITIQGRVRVSDANDSSASDASNNNFKIRGNLTITAPTAVSKWNVGTSQIIAWARVGSIANVRLEYSDNGGATFVPITNSTPNTGSYSWNVPDAITTQARVKVTNVDDTTIASESANFKIQGTFALTSPNGGEAWVVGSVHDVTWTTSGTINYVNLSYSTDGGTTYPYSIVTSQSNVGTYSWTVPDRVSGTVRLKVADTSDAEAFDISNANFRIRTTVILTSPIGAEELRVGYPHNVTWTTIGSIPNVKIEYSRFNFLIDINTVQDSTPNDGSYAWTIPDTISNTVRVRVSDPNDAGAFAASANDFRIITAFVVTAPAGGEMWDVASTHDVTWTCTSAPANVPQVKLEFSTDGGATYPYILAATDNDGVYSWQNIDDKITANLKVRVSDLVDPTAFAVSPNPAKIRAKFTVTSPNGSEIWTVAEEHNITWTTIGTVPNVRLDYSTNGFTTSSPIVASTPNDGVYEWTLPNAISTNARVRVMSATDTDAYDISDNAFKIRGAFRVTAPNGAELWLINQTSAITWVTTGTIPNVRILYSTDSGANYSGTVINSVANTNTYNWLVPDTASPNARVRVIDAADATVYDDSDANFRIRGFFTLTAPNGAESWIVGTQHAITWVKGGTIGYKLLYSTDGGATYPNTIVTNVNPLQNTGSYTWTIPDALSLTARVRVEDPNDSLTNDESNANFIIRGGLVLTAPNGAERWVTNETRAITWTTSAGSIQNVKLEYSKNNFMTSTVIVASTPNNGSYSWVIPDDRSATVRVRVSDVTNAAVNDISNANFEIDYYTITWILRDLLTNEPLTNLSASEKITATEIVGWQQAGLTSPVIHDTPYGSWTTTWSCSGYGDKAQNFDFADGKTDQTFTLYMETSAVHIWAAYSEFAYAASDDKLSVTSWLERDGSVVSGAAAVSVEIYDQATLIQTLSSNAISSGGFFSITWNNTGLEEGKVYAVITDITNASGAHFRTPTSFSITEAKRLQATQNAVEDMRDVTLPTFQSSVSTLVTNKLDDQKNLISTKMDEQKQIIVDKTNEMVTSVNATLTSFETKSDVAIKRLQTGADQAVAAGESLEATAKRYSWNASVSPDPALTGDMLTFNCQGQPGLNPLIDIYNNDNRIIVLDRPMLEKQEGLYVYQIQATNDKFTAGKAYTYIITEQVTGGLVSGSGMVETTSITSIAGLAAAAPEAERAAKKVLEAVTTLQNVLVSDNPINIGLALTNLQRTVDDLPEQIAKEGGSSAQIRVLNEVADRLKAMVGEEGFDIEAMLEEALGENPTIKEIRSKTDAIQGVIKFLQELFEAKLGGMDAPIVSTSLATGSVKFRIAAANPSKFKTQKVPVKIYLPTEVKPKDIMDLGGLTLEYDQEKSIYYVYANDVELAPMESRVFEVEVEDIWFVPQDEMDGYRQQAQVMAGRLKNSEYAQAAATILTKITGQLDTIAKTQADEMMSREQHIGLYRSNLEVIDGIKEDIARLEKLMVAIGMPPEPSMLEKSKLKGESPSKKITWIVIFVIILFIGLLAAVFFFTWNSQVKFSENLIASARKDAYPERKPYSVEEGEGKKE